jgi:hypothetical protein
MLERGSGERHHDCCVVTEDGAVDRLVEPVEPSELLAPTDALGLVEPVELVEPAEPDELVGVVAEIPEDELDEDWCAASAGSWPVTSSVAIRAHAPTNSITAPVATRRRSSRARAARACRMDCAGSLMSDRLAADRRSCVSGR